jgi:hypothetical protein
MNGLSRLSLYSLPPPLPETELSANISIRQKCTEDQAFEVASMTVETSDTIKLPTGDYEVVASAEGRETVVSVLPLDLDALGSGAALEDEVRLTLVPSITP